MSVTSFNCRSHQRCENRRYWVMKLTLLSVGVCAVLIFSVQTGSAQTSAPVKVLGCLQGDGSELKPWVLSGVALPPPPPAVPPEAVPVVAAEPEAVAEAEEQGLRLPKAEHPRRGLLLQAPVLLQALVLLLALV